MFAYKGKAAGNPRQYIKNKSDKWGFKLFSRASEDCFIHDLVLYQGKTMLEAHSVPMSEQQAMGLASQISLRPGQHHVLLQHHSHLCGQLLHQPGDSAVPQRLELQVHQDSQGQQNRQLSIEVLQGYGEKVCPSWYA